VNRQFLPCLFSLLFLALAGCRSVIPVREIHTSSAPDISRVMLKNGTLVVFNADFGWYDKQQGIIEGVNVDSQHVSYHLSEVNKIELVRTYSIFFAAAAALVPLGLGIIILAKLLTFV